MSDQEKEQDNIIQFPGSEQKIAGNEVKTKKPYLQEDDGDFYENIKYTSIREEIHNYTIRIMEGNIMLGYNPDCKNFEIAKQNAETSVRPEDKAETTIAAIDSVNKKIHIVIGKCCKLLKDPLFEKQFRDFEVE